MKDKFNSITFNYFCYLYLFMLIAGSSDNNLRAHDLMEDLVCCSQVPISEKLVAEKCHGAPITSQNATFKVTAS